MSDIENENGLLLPEWYLVDEKGKPVSTFIPTVVAAVNLQTSAGVEQYVRLELTFADLDNQVAVVTVPLVNLDTINWFQKDKRCLLNPHYRKAKEYIANVILASFLKLQTQPEERFLLDRTGIHKTSKSIVYCLGDRIISDSPSDNPDYELAPLPFRLDIDPNLSPWEAFDGMRELISISPEIGRALLAHSISAITRSAYIAAGAAPCATIEITQDSGKFKSYYSATVTQLYNRADGVKPTTRLSSTDRFIEEILYDYSECTVVLDDRCTAESSKIKRKNDDTAEEIMRRIGDKTGRGRMSGKTRIQIEPRSNAVITGEYPTGTISTVARGLTIVPKTPIDGMKLDKYQRREPLIISTCYFFFIKWYVMNYDTICMELAERLTKLRETVPSVHPRLRETQFCLQTAFMLFLQFCEDSGFMTVQEVQKEYLAFGTQLVELIRAQNSRIKPRDDTPGNINYRKLIRHLYKSRSFRLAPDVEEFKRDRLEYEKKYGEKYDGKYDGVIYYDCLCLRGESLEKKLRKFFPKLGRAEVIKALMAEDALKLVSDKNSVQISGLNGMRFCAIKLVTLK